MAFKTRRQYRYEQIRKVGFTKRESYILSKVPFRVPYMDKLMKQRFKLATEAFKKGLSRPAFEKQIVERYRNNGWIATTRAGRKLIDVWAMLRDFAAKYKAKHPEYDSPWEKRQRDFKNFMRKVDKTILKYPRSMPVVKLEYLPGGGARVIE